jgi:hypothetical protein
MIGRRGAIAGGAALAALPPPSRAALPVPAGNRLGFDIIRNGSKLGTHVLTFEPAGNGLTVRVAVQLAYTIAGVTLYRYIHRATETWEADQVVGISSETNDDGTHYQVSGRREGNGLVVQGSMAPCYVAPAAALPATHWNRRELDGPWINTQDGRLMRPKVARQGIETIPTAGAGPLRAQHYALSGDVHLDMFYNDRLGWVGLSFVKRGAAVRYERQG